jgi:hypothetical protein
MAQAGRVTLPAGTCRVRDVDATGLVGLIIEGAGPRTVIVQLDPSRPAIDLTGSTDVVIRDVALRTAAPNSVPALLLMTIQDREPETWYVTVERIRARGDWAIAPLYMFGWAGITVRNTTLENTAPWGAALVISSDNGWGLTSSYRQVSAGQMGVTNSSFTTITDSRLLAWGSDSIALVLRSLDHVRVRNVQTIASGVCQVMFQQAPTYNPTITTTLETMAFDGSALPTCGE